MYVNRAEVGTFAWRDDRIAIGGPARIRRVARLHDGGIVNVAACEGGIGRLARFGVPPREDHRRAGEVGPAGEVNGDMANLALEILQSQRSVGRSRRCHREQRIVALTRIFRWRLFAAASCAGLLRACRMMARMAPD